jgi:two-component system, OmpR family, response regulator
MRSHHVLHVDDDAEIRIIVKLSLCLDPNLSVTDVGSAPEALEFLQSPDNPLPSVLLLDYYVGVTTGIDLLVSLRRNPRLRTVPAIFLSARIAKGEIEHMLAAGAVGVLAKPFNPLALAQEMRALLGE